MENTLMKRLILILAILTLAASAGWSTTVSCSTIANWGAAVNLTLAGNDCAYLGTIFSNFTDGSLGGIPDDWTLNFSGGANAPRLAISQTDLPLTNGDWDIHYTVSVGLGRVITGVGLAADILPNAGNATVTKDLGASGSLTTATGAAVAISGLSVTSLNIHESLIIGPNSSLTSFTDLFSEADSLVPEPTSLGLVGAGLLALVGLVRRFRRG
jgi:hypothetical protein